MADETAPDLKFEIGHVLFIDLVGYSKLLIEEQKERLRQLTEIVLGTAQVREAADEQLVRLPTGDGMALVFRGSSEEPARCALEIARALRDYPEITVRMGVHSGPVSEVSDLNGRTNIAGAGINMAQRVMDCGDGGHILVSQRAADDLAQYRQWSSRLHDLGECEVKHGVRLRITNLYTEELGNRELPVKFTPASPVVASAVGRSRSRSISPGVFALVLVLIGLAVLVALSAPALFRSFSSRGAPKVPVVTDRPALAPAVDHSIAVLPFADLSQAKDQEYFCEGISEEILDALAKLEGLRVVSRTSSFSFKGKNADVAEIANKLGVAHVLEGSLRRDGNRIRITAQLIDARDGFHLWSQTYEREMQNVFALQDEITGAIIDALKMKLVVPTRASSVMNTEAYDLYLQGVFFSNKSTEEGLRTGLDFFQRSLEKDLKSARAWAGIAKAWEWLADAYVKPLQAYPAMRAAAQKAISLDERNAEAHAYLGDAIRVLDWDTTGSTAELNRALQIDPNFAIAHLFLALIEVSQGRMDEGDRHRRAAVKGDPLSPIVSNFSAGMLISLGRFEEGIAEANRTLLLDPSFLYGGSMLGEAYLEKGMFPEAIELFQKAEKLSGAPQTGLALAYARMGREAEAREILDKLREIADTKYLAGEEIAAIYAALGENDQAFAWLDRAAREHSGSLHSVAIRPAFRPLHSDPRYAALLLRIGIDPAPMLRGQSP